MSRDSLKSVYILLISIFVIGLSLFLFFNRFIRKPERKTYPKRSFLKKEAPSFRKIEVREKPYLVSGINLVSSPLISKTEYLPLRFVGTLKKKDDILAYIEDIRTSNIGEYRVGERILGATVIKIDFDAVALLKDQRKIILTLNKPFYWPDPQVWIRPIANDSFVVSESHLKSKAKGINHILGEVVALPHIENGKIKGFLINSLKKDGFISQAGFKKGDIITKINGFELDGVKKPLEIYSKLRQLLREKTASIVKVELKRDNTSFIYTYHIFSSIKQNTPTQ